MRRLAPVGEDAAVHLRVQRDDAVVEHLGEAGDLGERASRGCRPRRSHVRCSPDDTSSQPRSCRPRAKSTSPVLSHTDSSARISRRPRSRRRSEDLGVETSLHFFDPLVQRLDGVVGEHAAPPPGRGSGRRRPRGAAMCTVQPVTFTPAASASPTACQPLNAGSSAGCVLTMRSGKASWIGFSRMVPKPAIATRSTSVPGAARRPPRGCTRPGRSRAPKSCARPARPARRPRAATPIAPQAGRRAPPRSGGRRRACACRIVPLPDASTRDPPHVGKVAASRTGGLRVLAIAPAAWSACPSCAGFRAAATEGGRAWT